MSRITREKIQPYIDKKLVNAQRHPEFPLTIYNYSKSCQYDKAWDDITTQCRGLILDDDDNIVARPFKKFFNYGEHDESEIPAEDAYRIITEKLDGSLGIIYYWEKQWYIATRGSFTSDQAIWATQWLREHMNEDLPMHSITMLCEIVYDTNRIVVKYDYEGLVHLATIDNEAGEQIIYPSVPAFMRRARTIESSSIKALIEIDKDNEEGFVVYYPDTDFRMKIKFPEYVRLHRLVTGVNAKTIWEMLRDGTPLDELLDRVPDEFNDWVKKTVKDIEFNGVEILTKVIGFHEEVKGIDGRKEQAMHITGEVPKELRGLVFSMLDGKDIKDGIFKLIRPVAEKPFTQEI